MENKLADRNITIALMRAYFNEGFNNSIENVLTSAFQKLENTKDRVVPIDMIASHLFAYLEKCSKTGGTFVRVLEFENGAIGVIDLGVSDCSKIVEQFVHPQQKDFLKREIVMLCVENYILTCNIGNKSGTMAASILNFGVKAEVIGGDVRMKIADVPDNTTIDEMNREGVKYIELKVTDFIQNLDVSTKGTASKRVMEYIWSSASGASGLKKRANLIGKLRLSRGRFSKHEVRHDEWLTMIGSEIVTAGSSDGYTIVLENKRRISNKQLRKSQSVRLRRYANSFSYEHAKQAMIQFYYDELQPIL